MSPQPLTLIISIHQLKSGNAKRKTEEDYSKLAATRNEVRNNRTGEGQRMKWNRRWRRWDPRLPTRNN